MADIATLMERLPQNFDASVAGDLNASVLFDLDGADGGQWTLNIANGQADVTKGVVGTPTATLKMDAEDYASMVAGDLNAMTAFMTGKIKVEGDLGTIMKMQSIFGL